MSATLTHTAVGGEYTDAAAELAVTVDDDETLGLVLSESSLSVDEGDTTGEAYTVKLSDQPTVSVTVTVTGQAETDLTLTGLNGANTLTFTADDWDTAQTVTVAAAQDDDAIDEAVTLTHTAAGGEYEGVTKDLPVKVDDDETLSVLLSESSLTVDEGATAGGSYTVKLSHEPNVSVTVTVTGQAETDLTLTGLGTGSTLTFTTTDWDTAQTVTVKAAQDDDAADDSVTLTHTAAGGEYEGVTADLSVTVDDDDRNLQVVSASVSYDSAVYSVAEGDTTTVVARLSEALETEVIIPLTRTNEGGASDADYSGVPATLTFTAGDTEMSLDFSAAVDTEDEDGEQVVLSFGTLPEGVSEGAVSQATIAIRDAVLVSFGASEYSATEGEDDAVVTVQLSEALATDMTVPLTAEGGGGATPDDWSGVPEELTFSAGETSKTFTVVAVDDTVEDDGEMVKLGFGTLPAGLRTGSPDAATITLMNIEEVFTASCDGNDVWCATIGLESVVGDQHAWARHYAPGWVDVDRDVTYGGLTYVVSSVFVNRSNYEDLKERSKLWLHFESEQPPSEPHIAEWRLLVGSDLSLSFADAVRTAEASYLWNAAEFYELVGGTEVTLRIMGTVTPTEYVPVAANSPATGTITVSGVAEVGRTLTMDASQVQEADGMTVTGSTLRYYWEIVGKGLISDEATYRIGWSSEGERIRARVSFTDDAGNRETVFSEPTAVVRSDSTTIEDLAVRENTDGSITLTWSAPANRSVSSYQILRERHGSERSPLAVHVEDTGSRRTSYTDKDFEKKVLYTYQVRAITPDFLGTLSNPVHVVVRTQTENDDEGDSQHREEQQQQEESGEKVTKGEQDQDTSREEQAPSPPPAPANQDGTIALTWDAPKDDSVIGYQILRRRPGEGEDTLLVYEENTENTKTTFTDTDVTAGTRYVYRVKAINEAGTGDRSNYVNVTL